MGGALVLPPTSSLETVVFLAGLGQLALVVASLAIPRVLDWRADVAQLRPLTRQVFWTYAGYIWCTNLCFGLVSTFGPAWLLDRSPLATVVTAYIAVYWAARVAIQFLYFDRSHVPPGPLPRIGEVVLVGLFVALTFTYGAAVFANLQGRAA
jgi:hypothetical protein